MLNWLRRLLLGSPLPSWRAIHERLPKVLALPVFSSDAISSVAYASEEILLALALAGALVITQTRLSIYIALAIITLLVMVVVSYRQTIFSYPSGGGSYIVAKENLGTYPGLIAGASLMIDYVLTVAVSVSSGVAAILSFAPPEYQHYRVGIIVAIIAFIALANMRGVRESGLLFCAPTYTFIASAVVLIAVGLYRFVQDPGFTIPPPPAGTVPVVSHPAAGFVFYFLILRAFAGGCSAMTGTEAISNGIPAFRPPESKNAAATLAMMAALLGPIFFGITYIAWRAHVIPMEQTAPGYQTVCSQIAVALFGKSWFYYLFQGATMGILAIAANTSFAGFPRLGSIMSRDRFLPRQLYNLGDRLVFSNGIILLALLASVLVIVFKGVVNSLIPLYAIGVFLSFTLSQAGMVSHFVRLKDPRWRYKAAISATGATVTAIVVVVQATTKATQGAWIVLILIPLLVYMFSKIHGHYMQLGNQLRLTPEDKFSAVHNTVLVLTPSLHRGILPALEYAKGLAADVRAIHVESDPSDTKLLEERWEQWGGGIPLVILESPYRSLVGPLLQYLDEVKRERENSMITVVIPEFVPAKWWHKIMHNQSGLLLKFVLLFEKGVITTNVRYYLER
ncbi:MAG TPA: APC family permease [Armatimonadota bacterium]|nr:APC family permease [Armatimonadota bacterium]